MHRKTASLLHSPTDPHTTQLTTQHKLRLSESAMGLGLSTKELQHHMQFMHFSVHLSAKHPAMPLSALSQSRRLPDAPQGCPRPQALRSGRNQEQKGGAERRLGSHGLGRWNVPKPTTRQATLTRQGNSIHKHDIHLHKERYVYVAE